MPYCHSTPVDSCPICQRYLTDAEFRLVIDAAPPAPVSGGNRREAARSDVTKRFGRVKSPCVHLGKKVLGRPCGTDLYECGYDDSLCSKYKGCTEAKRKCETCNYYSVGSNVCS